MSRQLGSIQRILSLDPIPGADAVEVAGILGWKVVVKKGEFQVGDPCLYCEIDSILPDRAEFAFLKDKGFRIKTVRIRGQISQGIAFAPRMFQEFSEGVPETGTDVTERFGIQKYEPPPMQPTRFGTALGSFPDFIPKTDEVRIQSNPDLLKQESHPHWYATEKLDGTSITFYRYGSCTGVCSRNQEIKVVEPGSEGDGLFSSLYHSMGIPDRLDRLYGLGDFALQGELIGPKVQGNKYQLKELSVRFFNLYLIDEGRRSTLPELKWALETAELEMVPLLGEDLFPLASIQEAEAFSQGMSLVCSQTVREGIVVRNALTGTSFKVVNPNFLLKFGE